VTELRVVPLDAFHDRVSMAVAVAAVERGFRALAAGEAALPDPLVAELTDRHAEIHVKGALLRGDRYVVLKVATGFYRNRERGLPSGDGLFLLLDAETGRPAWLLEEHGYLTDLRTAAAIALTLKYLAPQDATAALLVGAGAVGRLAARAIIAERPITRLTIWNRTPERAAALARELAGVVETRVAGALDPEVRAHRIIVTATASTVPLILAGSVHPGTHVTSAGTGSPEKVELEPALLARADKLVADRVAQTERYGNLRHAIAAGAMGADRVYAELGDLALGRRPGRERAEEITVADLTGVGVQDAGIAQAVVAVLEGGTP
jgi:ornithine cyclodeaminase